MECEGEGSTQSNESSLIPGLPDDIAFSCLAKIPRNYLPVLNCVSKRWKEVLSGDDFYTYRVKHHFVETWIYALCSNKSEQLCMYVLDPNQVRKGWRRVYGIPDRCSKRKGVGFEVLGKKIFMIGGCGWVEEPTDEVYCYDAVTNSWSQASPLSKPRCYSACEALNGKIYTIGGIVSTSSNPHSWDVYDPQTSSWTSYEDPKNGFPPSQYSMVLDGKIYIHCGYTSISPSSIVHEPSTGKWEEVDNDMAGGWHGPAVVIDGILYVLDQRSGIKVMMWDKTLREWFPVQRLSVHLTIPPCRLVAIGKKILVIGKGLSTVMFDVNNASRMDRVLVSSSAPRLSSDEKVISCKPLAV